MEATVAEGTGGARPARPARLAGLLGRRPAGVLAGAAVLLCLPSLVLGAGLTHSGHYNHVWAELFSTQFMDGDPYPRWLDGAFGGLGAPTFYFYPPLAFWVAAAVKALSLGVLPTAWQLAVTSALLLFLSGLSMRLWLREHAGPAWATGGALAYMAAPYHLLVDHYMRGALAEFSAYAVLPLLLFSLRRLSGPGRWGPALTAGSTAALVCAHLPVAVLACATVAPVYTLHLALARRNGWPDRAAFVLRAGACGALGLALAAPYLWPALALQPFTSAERLWISYFRPEPWLLLNVARWPEPDLMLAFSSLAAGGLILCAGLWRLKRHDGEARTWAFAGVAAVALMAGVVPGAWALPGLDRVQFPWRLLTVVEFAAVTTAVCVLPGVTLRRARPVLLAALVAGSAGAAIAIQFSVWQTLQTVADGGAARRIWSTRLNAADEYLPAGWFPPDAARTAERDQPLPAELLASSLVQAPGATLATAAPASRGGLRLQIETARPTRVVVKRFWFPNWTVTADGRPLRVEPHGRHRLVSFEAPAGRRVLEVRRRPLPAERQGVMLAVLVALALAGWAGAPVRRSAHGRSLSKPRNGGGMFNSPFPNNPGSIT